MSNSRFYALGVRDALLNTGFDKLAEEVVDPESGEPIGAEGGAPAGLPEAGGSPVDQMSDEEVIALIQSLPPEVQQAILMQLQQELGGGQAPEGGMPPQGGPEGGMPPGMPPQG